MMTHEQRLDRLERIARLMVRAGLRARREMRQQDDKITIMIDAQIKNEDRYADLAASRNQHDEKIKMLIDAQLRNEELFADLRASQNQHDEKIAMLIEAQLRTDERFAELAESQKQLAESLKHTDRRMDTLIDIVQKDRNGKSRKEK